MGESFEMCFILKWQKKIQKCFSGFTEEKDDDDFRDSSSETDESISSR